MKKAIVVGAGMTGCTWAHLLAGRGWDVLLLERGPRLGGGCQTLHHGGHPYTLGPRHLFTGHEHVYQYYCDRVPQRDLKHYLLTYVETDGQFYSYPIHSDDISRMSDCEEIQTH